MVEDIVMACTAVEAKEYVKVERESKTHTITFQNYFRMYRKLSGMTGTALTEEAEFRTIYGLDVVCIPTNKEIKRKDESDSVYKSVKAKNKAILSLQKKQMLRVNQFLSVQYQRKIWTVIKKIFNQAGLNTLRNVKNHQREAEIIAQAGRFELLLLPPTWQVVRMIFLGGNPSSWLQELRKQGFDPELAGMS